MEQHAEQRRAQPKQGTQDSRIGRTRAAVLAAARAILIEEGWDAVTHQRVAERSGVHRGTIWRHWPQRSTLIHEALADETILLLAVDLSGDLRSDLVALLEALRHLLVKKPLVRVAAALIDRSEWQSEVNRLKTALIRDGFQILRQVLRTGIDVGQLRSDLDVHHCVAQLVGPLFYRRLLSGERISINTIQTVVDDFLATYQRSATSRVRQAESR